MSAKVEDIVDVKVRRATEAIKKQLQLDDADPIIKRLSARFGARI